MTQRTRWIGFLATTAIAILLVYAIVNESSRQEQAQAAYRATAITDGIDLYAHHCASCHGAAGEGLGIYPALNEEFVQHQDQYLLFNVIARGRYRTEMVAYSIEEGGNLVGADITNLVMMLQAAPWERVEARVIELDLVPEEPEVIVLVDDITFDAEALALGTELFATYCVECHGDNGQGTDLAPPLTSRYVASMPAQQLLDTISFGVSGTEMDSFSSTLTQEDKLALVAVLRSWNAGEAAPPPSDAVPLEVADVQGRATFEAWCAPCHGISGEGSSIAPALNDIPTVPADFIATRVRTGFNAMPPFSENDMPDDDLWVLIAYVQNRILGSGLPTYTEADMLTASDLYALHCTECHGRDGLGVEDKGPRLITIPPMHASEIYNFVRLGSAEAEAFPAAILPDGELRLIIGYIHSLSNE